MLGDLFDFAKFHAKDAWSQIKDNPERMFLGAATPAGTKLWGGILGKDWEPMVNPYGGATEDQFARADAKGLNTGPSRQVGGIADTIAGIWGGAGAMGGLGNAASSMGGGGASGGLGGIYGQADLGGQNGMGGLYTQADTGGLMAQGGGGGGIMDMISQGQQLQGLLGGQQQQQAPPPPPPQFIQAPRAAPHIDTRRSADLSEDWMKRRKQASIGPLGRGY